MKNDIEIALVLRRLMNALRSAPCVGDIFSDDHAKLMQSSLKELDFIVSKYELCDDLEPECGVTIFKKTCLEDVGYRFNEEPIGSGIFFWHFGSLRSDASFDSENGCIDGAWKSASEQVCSTLGIPLGIWSSLNYPSQRRFIYQTIGTKKAF